MFQPELALEVSPWTVTQLTTQVKDLLEGAFVNVWVVGEISNFRPASSGHLYFNLKDQGAILHMVMWRNDTLRLNFLPQDGQEVLAHGRLTVYAARGDYQLSVDEMVPRGEGPQDLALRQLKEKLQRLGYFAQERKKPIPSFPRRIALVTSPTGAAIRDMLEILGRRWPLADLLVCPVRVQGVRAAEEMARALKQLNALPGVDVVLLGRGGGSREDLGAFNEEVLARAIFASKIPIISAVGHEIDITIADLVADRRALTPSEAAELATPDRYLLLQDLLQHQERLHNLMRGRLQLAQKRVQDLATRRVLRQPRDKVRDLERRVDDLKERLDRAVKHRKNHEQRAVEKLAAQLQSLSPLNVLARGYSLTRTDNNRDLVRSVRQVHPGDRLEVLVQDGRLLARVEQVLPPDPRLQAEGTEAHE